MEGFNSGHRIDFVLLPVEWSDRIVEALVVTEIPLAYGLHEDHRPVMVRVTPPFRGVARGAPPWLNRAALKFPSVSSAIQQAWAQATRFPKCWSVEQMSHAWVPLGRAMLAECAPPSRATLDLGGHVAPHGGEAQQLAGELHGEA